jgi:hypothetical protein
MQINSHILKLSGKAELPNEIEMSNNYSVKLEGAIDSFSVHDNDDGTFDKIYSFKPVRVEVIDRLGKSLKAKDPRKKSQQMRSLMMKKWRENNITEDFEIWHDKLYNQMMSDLDLMIAIVAKK